MDANYPVLVPAYNEANTIGNVILRCHAYSSLVLVVDDGSSDDTASIATEHGAVVLRNLVNQGLGASLRRGFSHLFREGYKYVVTVDGDGVHEPEFIPNLVNTHLSRGADLTIGSRFMSQSSLRTVPSPKKAANRFATILVNRVLGGKALTDVASGMRVVGERVFSIPFEWNNFAIAYELLSAAIVQRLRIEESPISVYYSPELLFCTKRNELEDLLGFASLKAEESRTREMIDALLERIRAFSAARVVLGGAYFVLHPVRDYNSYVFQDSDCEDHSGHWLEVL